MRARAGGFGNDVKLCPLVKMVLLPLLLWLTTLDLRAAIVPPTYTFRDLYPLTIPSGLTGPMNYGFHPVTNSGAVAGSCALTTGLKGPHALLWDGNSVPIDLTPIGVDESVVYGVNGNQQVGYGYTASSRTTHALLWNGTNTAIDLHPTSGFGQSFAYAVGGTQQVGWGYTASAISQTHALLWNGTKSAVDLHPSGFEYSSCYDTDGGQQVGFGYGPPTLEQYHALLWSGTNQPIDLNPVGFRGSFAYGVGGGQQVGSGSGPGFLTHALLWNGTNAAVDLNPIGYLESYAVDTNGQLQVGYGEVDDRSLPRALLWSGTNQATDLGALVPSGFLSSRAYAIDSAGNIFGLASGSGGYHAVEWVANVPEPTVLPLLGLSLVSLRQRRRNCSSR